MATVFIGLVLITFIANAIVTKSRTKWWRDPASLFRNENEPEQEPVSAPARARQPWEIIPRHETPTRGEGRRRREAPARAGLRSPRESARPRRAAQPRTGTEDRREVAPRPERAVQPVPQAADRTPRSGRHAMRSNPAPAVPIEFAETEIIDRIPSEASRL